MTKIVRFFIGVLIAGCLVLPAVVFGAAVVDPLNRPSIKAKTPARAVLLDVALAGSRLVAVGERGVMETG
jgi:hypothetical protein